MKRDSSLTPRAGMRRMEEPCPCRRRLLTTLTCRKLRLEFVRDSGRAPSLRARTARTGPEIQELGYNVHNRLPVLPAFHSPPGKRIIGIQLQGAGNNITHRSLKEPED